LPVNKPNSRISHVGQALKDYRKQHNITQEQLAEDFGIDPRTLRLWENERPPESVRELRRISDLLGIEPERFGLVASLYIPRTPEEIEAIIQHVWNLMDEVRISEALTIIEHLLQDLRQQITKEDPRILQSFAHALQVAGYVNSMYARTSEVPLAINHYHEMEEIARILDDPTMLTIALTYQGDMYRRQGDIQKAIPYLEAARDITPEADAAARERKWLTIIRACLSPQQR
jgi:transcriptional regulator with XRE-family HTH domain